MFHRESIVSIPPALGLAGEVEISATHFSNEILLQIRYNGEMDTTYEVAPEGLRPFDERQLAGFSDTLDENEAPADDQMANYKVVAKLGDSNDAKLPVVCTQIADLYQQVILPTGVDKIGVGEAERRNLLITMSSKLWSDDTRQFERLVFILNSVKQMYI
ncbi:hypothetical protein HG536_0E04400 [Torulaspora globosa]|uniref:Proteasome assembly chaperone 3 n=1 Tax=Torulaspora globosa TaxID=48254 RepID=A0A7G3ZJ43_9SACH|nr:uncharacterized protein HG536_0E04400 [Torulaspora globosa]QLL33529.1 hypothetical protein HG536_0E04400 [Torulaspora globosa]